MKAGAEEVTVACGVVAGCPTVRTVDAVEKHGWQKIASAKFLGTEAEVPLVVEPDEYCVPELLDEKARKKWDAEFESWRRRQT